MTGALLALGILVYIASLITELVSSCLGFSGMILGVVLLVAGGMSSRKQA